jgi:hypothetical protein
MAFTHIQGNSHNATGVTTLNVVLGGAPTLGNLVCVTFSPGGSTISSLAIKDSNNNSYAISGNSPSTFISGAGQIYMAYLLSAPANASATITATWTTVTSAAMWADEFHYTGGTCSFDIDIAASTASSAVTINTPSITPAGAGELLYSGAAAGGTISAPVAGGSSTNGIWTGSDGAIAAGDMAEYILSSASGATAVNYTQSSGAWSAMAMAFILTASGGVTTPSGITSINDEYQWVGDNS